MSEQITVEIKDKLAIISINREDIKNALNLGSIQELTAAVNSLNENAAIRCIILGSKSKEVFCSGADLKEFTQKTDLQAKTEYFEALAELIMTMKKCPKPIITKIHGYALAGGLALVAAADIVLAANDAKFSLPELKVGMVPGIVMLALEEVMSKRALNFLSLSADIIDAEDALRIGLVSKIYDDSVLDKKTMELAEEISAFSREALSATKRMLLSSSNAELETKLELRAKEMAVFSLSPDCIEGIDAYLNKRKAQWK